MPILENRDRAQADLDDAKVQTEGEEEERRNLATSNAGLARAADRARAARQATSELDTADRELEQKLLHFLNGVIGEAAVEKLLRAAGKEETAAKITVGELEELAELLGCGRSACQRFGARAMRFTGDRLRGRDTELTRQSLHALLVSYGID